VNADTLVPLAPAGSIVEITPPIAIGMRPLNVRFVRHVV
jgi:hypothetical protein